MEHLENEKSCLCGLFDESSFRLEDQYVSGLKETRKNAFNYLLGLFITLDRSQIYLPFNYYPLRDNRNRSYLAAFQYYIISDRTAFVQETVLN